MGGNNITLTSSTEKSICEESSQQITHTLNLPFDVRERLAPGLPDIVIFDPCLHLGSGWSISSKTHPSLIRVFTN
jgi:hypothetical protein